MDCEDWSLISAQVALWGFSPFADLGLGACLNYDWTRWHISLKSSDFGLLSERC